MARSRSTPASPSSQRRKSGFRSLNDVMDARYEDIEEGSDFALLVDTMSAGRDDARLMQIVLDIRGRVQAHPAPFAWLD